MIASRVPDGEGGLGLASSRSGAGRVGVAEVTTGQIRLLSEQLALHADAQITTTRTPSASWPRAWLYIIWHCWQAGVPYDPTQHRALRALHRDHPTAA